MAGRVEFYKDEAGEFRFRVKGGNGEIVVGSSQGYRDMHDADRAFNDLRDLLREDGIMVMWLGHPREES